MLEMLHYINYHFFKSVWILNLGFYCFTIWRKFLLNEFFQNWLYLNFELNFAFLTYLSIWWMINKFNKYFLSFFNRSYQNTLAINPSLNNLKKSFFRIQKYIIQYFDNFFFLTFSLILHNHWMLKLYIRKPELKWLSIFINLEILI
jgi:hypothetical protein